MKLLTLTVTDVENTTAEYDFAEGNIHAPEEAIHFLEYALFGNDVLFSGKIVLTAEQNEDMIIRVERDFAGDLEVYKNEDKLDSVRAEKMLSQLAGLKQHQWAENMRPVSSEEVLSNVSSFIKKYLSELGFDAEELEKRWDFYYKDHSLFVSKVEAYDELVDDSYIKIAEDRKVKMLSLREKLDAVTHIKQSAEEKGLILSLKQSLSEKKEILLQKEAEIEEKSRLIEQDEALLRKIEILSEISADKKEADEVYSELDRLVEDISRLQEEIIELQTNINEKSAEAQANAERATGLMESFEDILQSNLDDKELTNAVLAKTEDVISSTEAENPSGLAAELQATHFDFKKQRAVREGVAFENSFENSEVRIADLTAKIEQNTALMDSIKAEIADAEGFVPAETSEEEGGEETAEAPVTALGTRPPCDDKSLDIYEAKVLARNLEKEITVEENQIRAALKIRKTQLEDIDALKKAKVAQEEYVRRCEKKKVKYDEKLLISRSRIAFNGNKAGLEIGDACPVCNSRLTNKADVAAELDKLGAGYQKLLAEAEENDRLLVEAKEKLADINIRLTRLSERIASGVITINGLTDSVREKQTKLSEILSSRGVKTVADLERRYRALPYAGGGDGAAIQSHIAFLQSELDAIAATVEEDKTSLAEEKERLAAMKADYEEEIKPALDGKLAIDSLDEIIENDKKEDIIIAELNGGVPLGDSVISTDNGNAEIYVNVTAEIFANVMDEIKKSEDDRTEAEKDSEALRNELNDKNAEYAVKVAKADELKEKADNLAAGIPDALAAVNCTDEDLDKTEEMQKELLDEKEKSRLVAEVKRYRKDLQALDIQLSALEDYGEVEFNSEDYADLRAEAEKAEKSYRKAATRLAVSEAAKELAIEKAAMCGVITEKMDAVKKLSDGEIFEVVMPVINDFLTAAETNLEALPDGDTVEFIDVRKGKKVKTENVGEHILNVMIDCMLNYVVALSSGEETTRFSIVGGKGEKLKLPARKFGVIVL